MDDVVRHVFGGRAPSIKKERTGGRGGGAALLLGCVHGFEILQSPRGVERMGRVGRGVGLLWRGHAGWYTARDGVRYHAGVNPRRLRALLNPRHPCVRIPTREEFEAKELVLLLQLWAFPTDITWIKITFALNLGPLVWSIVAFRNSLVYHYLDKRTSHFMYVLDEMGGRKKGFGQPAASTKTCSRRPHRTFLMTEHAQGSINRTP